MKGISGEFKSGTSTAIIGPSGSGKTTLVNFLCANLETSTNLFMDGQVRVNGHKIDSINEFKHRFGYIKQEEELYEELTVREQLLDMAILSNIKNPIKATNKTIGWLGLEDCQNTRVGGILTSGLSGGQKKRLSIALEMIFNPSVIFMDEPTTGLDSKNALDVAKLIKAFAKNGRTVIATIHQPSNDILSKFDRVIFLTEGRILYDRKTESVIPHFASIGFPALPRTNPGEHLMRIAHEDSIKIEMMNKGLKITPEAVRMRFENRLQVFVEGYEKIKKQQNRRKLSSSKVLKEIMKKPKTASPIKQIHILVFRFYLCLVRNPKNIVSKILEMIFLASLDSIGFTKMNDPEVNTLAAIQDRRACAFAIQSSQCFSGIFLTLKETIPRIPKYKVENQKRLYSPILYYFVSNLHQIPIQLGLTYLYLRMTWVFIGDYRSDDNFGYYYLTLILCFLAGVGFADILSYLIQNVEKVVQVSSFIGIPLYFLSGMVVKIKDVVKYLYLVSYASFFRFGYQASMYLEFTDEKRKQYLEVCKLRPKGCFENKCAVNLPGAKACDVKESMDFPEEDFAANIRILFFHVVIFRVIALAVFCFMTSNKRIQYKDAPKEILKQKDLVKKKDSENRK